MTPSDELFQLIHSMTGPEKGYFKKHSSVHVLHGENIYIKLFDAIDEQSRYDEKQIKVLFKKESFVKHLTVIKNYLYKQISESLIAYHEESKIKLKIRGLISTAEILYEKNLFKSFFKTLEKAKKLAYEHEEYYFIPEILSLEKKIIYTDTLLYKAEDKFCEIKKEETNIAKLIKYHNQSENIYLKLPLQIRKTGIPDTPTEVKEYNQIMKELKKHAQAKTSNVKNIINHYNTLTQYYLTATREHGKMYAASVRLLAVYESNKKITNNSLSMYIQALNNHILVCELTQKEKERIESIKKLKQIPQQYPLGKNEIIEARIFETVAANEMMHIRKRMKYENAEEALTYFEINEKKYAHRLKKNRLLLRYFTAATICLHMGKAKDCNKWLNKIFKEDIEQFGPWLYSAARSLQLIAHYEMGNYELVSYLKKSGKRFHEKKDKLHSFQKLFFNFFSENILSASNESEIIKHFSALKEKLILIKNNPKQNSPFEFFNYIAWAQSKIERKPILEILRGK